MKNINKFIAASLVLACLSSATYGQTVQATATAEIVAPIAMTKNADFNFGRLATSAGGNATLGANGAVTPGAGVAVVAGGTPTAASFTVLGQGTLLYTIVFPGSVNLDGAVSGVLTMGTFTTSAGAGTLTGGTQTFTAGATITLPATPAAGTYVSDPFDVTVSYN